jgi:hypothetical protein
VSNLTDKVLAMRNMNDEELKDYIKTLTDNEKNLVIFSAIKMMMDINRL